MASTSVLGMAWRQTRMVEHTVRRSSSRRTAFLLPDISDHFSPSVMASKRNFAIGSGCGGWFVSCSMIFPFQYNSWFLLLSVVSNDKLFSPPFSPHVGNESFVVYFCFQKHNTLSIFSISSWDHMTITFVGLVSTKSSHFSCSSDLFVPQRRSLLQIAVSLFNWSPRS